MTYFLLSITNKCNKSCGYCVVKPWLNKQAEFPDKLNAADLISWLGTLIQSGDVAEITGGEPTLFPELTNLLDFLLLFHAKVILRTNGFHLDLIDRSKYDNMIVILAKHDSPDSFIEKIKPLLKPWDLLKTEVDPNVKQAISEDYGMPKFATPTVTRHGFDRFYTVTNDGVVRVMFCQTKPELHTPISRMGTIWEFNYNHTPWYACPECPYGLGAWELASFIPSAKDIC
jgi:organic radical activating enzyme